jgi:ATP-dependent exoDNAse (exonuclease V) beta subunit
MRLADTAPSSDIVESARRLLSFDDRSSLDDETGWLQEVARAFVALRSHEDVRHALDEGDVRFELPFSMRVNGDPPLLVHGVIDALVARADGSLVVVEFKTGRPASWHAAQVALYEDAVGRLFPGRPVRSLLAYPGAVQWTPRT